MRRALFLVSLAGLGACSLSELDEYSSGGPRRDAAVDADSEVDAAKDGAVDSAGAGDTGTAKDTGALDTGTPLDTGSPDTGSPDTGSPDTGSPDTGSPDTGGTPYRHTIAIDGANDFAVVDKLTTTTASFDAWVSWDASALYLGYAGVDFGTGAAATKWLLVYVDADASGTTGATKSEAYGAQQHQLPSGFGADAYFAWKTDDSFQQFRKYGGGVWSTVASSGVTSKRNAAAAFVELRIPFTALGISPGKIGVVSFMLNEDSTGPWTWAGLYTGSFVDGLSPIATPKAIGSYLLADLASSAVPNAAANRKP